MFDPHAIRPPGVKLDQTRIEGLRVDGSVGVYDFERTMQQTLVIDVTVHSDLRMAGLTDDLAHTVDYDGVSRICRSVVGSGHHHLIERIAADIAHRILMEITMVEFVEVRVAKPGAVPDAADVAVIIERARSELTQLPG